ncbi:hypothetical protein [Nocardioides plantarum]|uniref:DUF732 domain-containing protein n=1 Tax=Nocardioides plantarum TaxID=29299 RepID=A0ABV5KFL4_9ACTN|nr:hypothetical protein [Nocardioides plantarum]
MRPTAPRGVLAPAAVVAVVGAALLVRHDGGTPGGDAAPTTTTAPSTSSTPTVTAERFCDGFGALAQARQDLLVAASPAGVRALHEAAAQVDRLATGTALPADARAGIDFVVAALLDLDEDTTAAEVMAADQRASLRDESHAEALSAYIVEHCG